MDGNADGRQACPRLQGMTDAGWAALLVSTLLGPAVVGCGMLKHLESRIKQESGELD